MDDVSQGYGNRMAHREHDPTLKDLLYYVEKLQKNVGGQLEESQDGLISGTSPVTQIQKPGFF